ncbi:LPS export ABC transporter permease LptG [Parendozoicomonas haliclonae]|uniref:Lipopolysaccharide export system permease protein LptG n=1 Tax=Parendozoicomonas haliclonae TaxID=1960125 RepID=A0A1X7AEL6_9GAMM|nr:LPS export ABC transporter permease LptG [Parendozoicomonas haliclonae]SMA32705.1 Lipopolysaccharide export system permease protein LptG [Parendozoicomonas haliclonae]
MKKLDRYIGLNVLVSMLVVMVIIVFLDTLFGFMTQLDAMRANYQLPQVMQYMLLTTPKRIYEIIPVSALIGCLVGLGALANHSELIVMRAAGVSLSRIGWAVMKPAIVLMLIGLVLSEYVSPVSEQMAQSLKKITRSADGKYTDEGLWHREGDSYMYFNAVEPNGVLYGISIFRFDEKRQVQETIYAERAINQGNHWMMENVETSTYTDGQVETRVQSTKEWLTDLTTTLLKVVVVKPDDLSMTGLLTYIDYLDKQDLETGEYQLAFYKKVLQPAAIFALVLIGMSFVFGPLRTVPMGLRLFSGVITGVTFMILQNLAGPASLVFGFSPLLAVTLPIGICFVIGVVLLKRAG